MKLLSFLVLPFVVLALGASPAGAQQATQPGLTEAVDPAAATDYNQLLRETLEFEPDLPTKTHTADTLRSILASPEFQEGGTSNAGPGLFERIMDWLGKLFGGGQLSTGSPAVFILTALVVLGVLYLIVRLVWQWFEHRAVKLAATDPIGTRLLSVEELLQSAAAAAQAGEFREAIRWRFLALVQALELTASTLATNSQLARHVARTLPGASNDFLLAAAQYEDAWYGGLPAVGEDYATLTARAKEILRMKSEAEGAGAT